MITCIFWSGSDMSVNSRKYQCKISVQRLQEVNFYYFDILNGICCCRTNKETHVQISNRMTAIYFVQFVKHNLKKLEKTRSKCLGRSPKSRTLVNATSDSNFIESSFFVLLAPMYLEHHHTT
jgi:hypothetical protein